MKTLSLAVCIVLVALSALATRAAGDNALVLYDYADLFERHAGEVEAETLGDGIVRRTLMLPGPVQLMAETKNGETTYSAWDGSSSGAVICTLHTYEILRNLIQTCTDVGTAEQTRWLDRFIDRTLEFAAQNAVPPVDEEALKRQFMQQRDRHRGKARTCRGTGSKHMDRLIESVESTTKADVEEELKAFMTPPRLPVLAPCL